MEKKTVTTKRKVLNIFYYLFFLAIAVFALYNCFKDIKFDEFAAQLKSANYFLIGLSVLAGILAYVIRSLRWNILINPLGYAPTAYNTYNAVMIGYMANLAVPRIGEITRCAVLNKTNKIPVDSLFGTVVTERIIDLITLFVAIVLVFLIRMEFFTRFITEKLMPQWEPTLQQTSFGFVALVVAIIIVSVVAIYFLFKWLLKLPSMAKLKKILLGLAEGLKSIFKMKDRFKFIGYTIIIWICYWLSSYLVIKALPSTIHLTAIDGLFLTVLGSLGWVVPVPGGMGSFHTFVAWGLTMYAIPFPDGVIFATISHESQLLGMVFLGLIALISVSVSTNKKSKNNLKTA